MSLLEIPYRFKQILQKKFESFFVVGETLGTILIPKTKKILKIGEIDTPIFDDEFSVFGKKINFFDSQIDWHKDVFSGEKYPLTFSKNINIRKSVDLSAKNVWEINRLQFLIHIVINYNKTKDEKFLDKFIELNESWIEANPYLLGVNWYSNIEVNIRLINWFFCWELLDAEELMIKSKIFKEFVNTKWLPIIYQHCKYSFNNPSKYSSANNHLVSEYSGLYLATSVWEFKESEFWRSYAKDGLEKEILKQHSNGVNKEEAAEYIQFITDFFLLPYIIGEKCNDSFSKEFQKALKQILDYILVFTDVNLNFPKYGDEDDGYVLNFSEIGHFNNFKSLLVSASIIFNDESYLSAKSEYDIKNKLLFSDDGYLLFEKLMDREKKELDTKFYPKEGHFIFRKVIKDKEIYAHFDVAPLGYLSIAAHGHSDILSFLIHVNGKAFFVDSGTFSYHIEKKWRSYFVSCQAHNTITLNNSNQAFHASDTMWLNHFKPEVISFLQTDTIERVVGTYNKKSSIQHVRSFQFNKNDNEFLIEDNIILKDNKKSTIFIPFHLHPNIKVDKKSTVDFLLTNELGDQVHLNVDDKLEWEIVRGSLDPILGWYSESFMQKEPTSVIFSKITINESIKLLTRIKVVNF
ncbi:alginate lyase family protein [Polaribacter sp. Hel1_33_96]|uniref:alginate lyase family protein n=1 Tax=Polaribacter sp. Hel1_33_96 TaxID=1336805 RepID=UPI0015D590D3|nr:alginate lyase family protein [Polaribacter sp. Hel1_33_96]